jgi:hypothetical protein
LKTIANEKIKTKLRELKGKATERSMKLTSDPTLEARDENTVGRIERKIDRSQKPPDK